MSMPDVWPQCWNVEQEWGLRSICLRHLWWNFWAQRLPETHALVLSLSFFSLKKVNDTSVQEVVREFSKIVSIKYPQQCLVWRRDSGSTGVIAALLISVAAAFYGDLLLLLLGDSWERAVIKAFYILIGGPRKSKMSYDLHIVPWPIQNFNLVVDCNIVKHFCCSSLEEDYVAWAHRHQIDHVTCCWISREAVVVLVSNTCMKVTWITFIYLFIYF